MNGLDYGCYFTKVCTNTCDTRGWCPVVINFNILEVFASPAADFLLKSMGWGTTRTDCGNLGFAYNLPGGFFA